MLFSWEGMVEAVKCCWKWGGTARITTAQAGRNSQLLQRTWSTSPRLRGEVGFYAQRKIRVRGTLRERVCRESPSPEIRASRKFPPLPQAGRGEEYVASQFIAPCRGAPRIRASSSAVGQESAGRPYLICIALTALRLCWPSTPSTLPTLKPARTSSCCSSLISLNGNCATGAAGRSIGAAPAMRAGEIAGGGRIDQRVIPLGVGGEIGVGQERRSHPAHRQQQRRRQVVIRQRPCRRDRSRRAAPISSAAAGW